MVLGWLIWTKKALTNVAITFARDNLPRLVSNLASNAKNKFKKQCLNGAGKGFAFFISNEDMNDIIKIIKSLEDSNVLTDGITETVKDEIKKNILLLEPKISSIVKCIRGRAVKKGDEI